MAENASRTPPHGGNVILQYSLITLLVTLVISTVLGFTLSNSVTDYQLKFHIQLFPDIVRLAARDNPELIPFLKAPAGTPVPPTVLQLFRDLKNVGKIFRIKVWNDKATILWSDFPQLIGQSFPEDDSWEDAMQGQPAYELGEAEKGENIEEKNKGITLQVYTPILHQGKSAGVIELYEANADLFADIARNTGFVWLLVFASGAVLYLLLFLVFYSAYRRQKRTNEILLETQDVTIYALAYEAELRDRQTGKHLERTSLYVRLIAVELAKNPQFKSYLSPAYIEDLVKSAPLHDIGKVGVSDAILLKPGRLTVEEMDEMKKHCEYGSQILEKAAEKLHFQSFLSIAIQLARHHHEKWDGSGYPKGLAAGDIPISARVMAVADVYDALRTERVYKASFPHEDCVAQIRADSGRHFDPDIVEAFLVCSGEMQKISEELRN